MVARAPLSEYKSETIYLILTNIICITRYTEIWSKEDDSFDIRLTEPILDNFIRYPELFLVDIGFCVKSE